MPQTLPDVLARIVEHKRVELAGRVARRSELEIRAEASRARRRDFRAALERSAPAVIAEIKKASPSKGVLVEQFDPPAIARTYERGGAAALSVLTDEKFFQGHLEDLEAARAAVALPALRKDFTIGEFQIVEAAAHQADAILLIAAILGVRQLRDFRELAAHYGLAALVEVHDAAELERAADSGATLIGVNNRNLRTFEVTLETSLRLAGHMPAGALAVSESGIHSRAGIDRLLAAGYRAFLVGEHLMQAADPAQALQALLR
ncbi:MAG: indole-3-glycerol phosphate synthase TrpC [Acidobacteria bacterium]|nr:indole-3-glycerol phosphate synthase TrpC [Acidobacteriota bacterium]